MPPAKFLIWVDLETTGTDEDVDPILEFGAIVTTAEPPFEMVFEAVGVFEPSRLEFPLWRTRLAANPVIAEMHAANGLIADINAAGTDITSFEDRFVDDLETLGRRHEFLLAGSGVAHFDRRFLDTQMPRLASMLQYPVLDVGILRRAARFAGADRIAEEFVGTTWSSDKPHRALDDVRDHLTEFRLYAAFLAEHGA